MTEDDPLAMPWAAIGEPVEDAVSWRMSHLGGIRNAARFYGNGRDWQTPPYIFDPLNREFRFTLDPCARPETAKLPRFYTEADDGLAQSWQGERVFMNPPYGREIYAWTQKAALEARGSALVVGLLPGSTDVEWFHRDVIAERAELRFIRGRVRFRTPDGASWSNAIFPSIVAVWRPRVAA